MESDGHFPEADAAIGPIPLSEEAIEAWRQHPLASRLSHSDEVLLDATEIRIPEGQTAYRMDELSLVVSGFIRVYLRSPDGREITLRYVSGGDLLGLPNILASDSVWHGLWQGADTLTECRLVRLSPARFRAVAERDASNMWGLFAELARLLSAHNDMVAENLFLPVRARTARHLLELAVREDHRLRVYASQRQVADAIGSVREVVSRTLVKLRDDGLIHRDGASYVIDDPAGLHVAATGRE